MEDDFWRALPQEFDPRAYQSIHADLAGLTDTELKTHYETFGISEGRAANSLRNRNEFTSLIPNSATALEIGPFCNPLLHGPNVSYFDVLSQEALVERARHIGLDPSKVPYIDYISPTGELSCVQRRFDVVLSSHCLEHQPDLIGHLQEVGQLLWPGGAYFLLVPDKRYCFDHFIPASNLAEVIVAHHEQRKVHSLRSVIEHHALTTHNDSLRHWQGDHGEAFENIGHRYREALREFDGAERKYIDVHAWYFTPDIASNILSTLRRIDLNPLSVQRVYSTRYGANEFWIILGA
jgi:SAM-dependent methyltransferase